LSMLVWLGVPGGAVMTLQCASVCNRTQMLRAPCRSF
jgi:hypothetical protein